MDKKTKFFEIDSKIVTSKSFYVFIHYIFWVWICDVINMIALFRNHEQDTIFVNVLAIVIVGIIVKVDRNIFSFEKTDVKCCFAIGILGIVALMYAVYPDNSFDTWVYHLMNQDPVWQGENGLSKWECLYPLADRAFYLFRYLLGFKLGTLFNWILLSLVYVQVVRIFRIVGVKENGFITKIFNPYVMAFLCISLETIFIMYSTYMTDLVSAPIILEAVISLLLVTQNEQIGFFEMIYFVLCLCFIFLMKLTTLVYIIPLTVIYIMLIRKKLTYKKFIGCCFVAVLIVMPYLVYNDIVSGMPFYPIHIFSELKSVANVNTGSTHDDRWGATNLLEIIFWPFLMAIKPGYRHMEIIRMPNIYPLVALCCGSAVIMKGIIKKEKEKKNTLLTAVSFISYYLWVLSRTVDRYGVCAIILCGVVSGCFVYSFINFKQVVTIVVMLLIFQAGCSYYSLMGYGVNFKWSPKIETVIKDVSYSIFNLRYGRDRGCLVSDNKDYKYYISPRKYYNSYGTFLSKDAVLYDLSEIDSLSEDDKGILYEELYHLQQEGNYFYTASMEGGLDGSIQDVIGGLRQYGFKVVDIEFMQYTYLGNIVVYKSVLSENFEDVLMFSEDAAIQIEMEQDKTNAINCLMFVSPRITWTKEPTTVTFYVKENDDNKVVIAQKDLIPGNTEHININVDPTVSFDSKLYIECNDNYGLDFDFVYMVSMER